ncbi:gluconeogenesis factor YvcK family protein [Endomicrobium proavitum]|uniref:gluconeogenesis factor YvcK family protein n=1 Tax=Endomicrobium proavitum TaxID=1408281 RepID=UPI00069676DA|nr:gluconeogenesis factor YvcK family protein [Endomicrobium proavitum]
MKKIKIAAIGGGTGLSTLLRGLKKYNCDITAIVNVADDGGSSGKLKKELGVLPPGDIRNCLVALSEEESLMSRLFQYRFPAKGALGGHSFGNLFLTAMSAISGGFDNAIARSGEVLAIRGQVLPVTLSSVTLEAELENGKIISGETKVSQAKSKIIKVNLSPAAPPAAGEVLEAIKKADAIIFGPGSLYTSIIVNFLVDGVTEALKASKAYKIYVANIMTQPGETSGYKLSDHIKAIEDHSYKGVVDCIIANSAKVPAKVAKRYKKQNSYQVAIDKTGIKTVKSKLFSNEIYARHNCDKLAFAINKIIKERIHD